MKHSPSDEPACIKMPTSKMPVIVHYFSIILIACLFTHPTIDLFMAKSMFSDFVSPANASNK